MSLPETDPGLFYNMYTARALRRFKPDPIPDDVLFQVFDAAIRAPSGQNVQDWRFIVIKDPAVKMKLQEWSQEGWKRYEARFAENPEDVDKLPRSQRLSIRSVEHLAHNIGSAPVVVCVTGLKGRHSTPGGSIFPAVQNLLLTARALGLAGSVFNFPLSHRDELIEMIELPENNEIYCLIPMGYPTDRHGRLGRKPVKKVVFMDKWANPWPFAEEQPENGWEDRWVPRD
jgi:nitroreductase